MVDKSSVGGGAAGTAAPAAASESAAAEGAQHIQPPEQQQQQEQQAAERAGDAEQGQQGGKRRRLDSAAEWEASPLQGEPSEPGASCFYDTVGCVVLAPDGSVAAGVSSGGILLKTEGRVGEAAAFGAGCWAQAARPAAPDSPQPAPQRGAARQQAAAAVLPALACSVTGVGEAVMRHLLARECCREAAAAADAASQAAASAPGPASSAAADSSDSEDEEVPVSSELPVAQVAAALLQRTVLRGPPPHDCGLLCLKAQPIEEAGGARQEEQQQNGGACSAADARRAREPVRYAVEVSVAHCAQSMAVGHLACSQPGGTAAGGSGGSAAASRAAVPAVFVLRRQAGCSGRPAPVVQTYTHGTTLLL